MQFSNTSKQILSLISVEGSSSDLFVRRDIAFDQLHIIRNAYVEHFHALCFYNHACLFKIKRFMVRIIIEVPYSYCSMLLELDLQSINSSCCGMLDYCSSSWHCVPSARSEVIRDSHFYRSRDFFPLFHIYCVAASRVYNVKIIKLQLAKVTNALPLINRSGVYFLMF
jgi:hypothetical protein